MNPNHSRNSLLLTATVFLWACHTAHAASPTKTRIPSALQPAASIQPSAVTAWPAAWSLNTPPPDCQPVFAGAAVFQMCGTTLNAVDIVTHKALWQHDLGDTLPVPASENPGHPSQITVTAPTVAGDTVIIGLSRGLAGHVVALDRATGKPRWDFDAGLYERSSTGTTLGAILSRPALWRDRVVFRSGQGLTAVSIATGKQLWNVPLDPSLFVPFSPSADPAGDDKAIYFNSDFGMAYAFDPRDGGHIWRTQTDAITIKSAHGVTSRHITFTHCPPLLLRDKAIIADGLGNIYGLSAKDGHILWQRKASYVFEFAAALGNTFAATSKGLLQLDSETGKLLREYSTPSSIVRCMPVSGRLIFARFPTGLELFDLKSWSVIASDPLVDARQGLALSGNTLLVAAYAEAGQAPPSQLRAYRLPATQHRVARAKW